MYKMKRVFDLTGAAAGLMIAAPLMVAAAAVLRTAIGPPVIFKQVRPGLGGRPFTLYKFRTMTNERDEAGQLLPDAERMTPVGEWLRRSSLDELPQLLNVVKGDLSIVGPRPLLTAYLPLYSERQQKRHDVRPGITGWAQVNGRNTIPWQDRLEMDVWYVENQSLCLDIKIVLMTVMKVLKRDGISQEGESTVQPFLGNNQ